MPTANDSFVPMDWRSVAGGTTTAGIVVDTSGATGLTIEYNLFIAGEDGDDSIRGSSLVDPYIFENSFAGPGPGGGVYPAAGDAINLILAAAG